MDVDKKIEVREMDLLLAQFKKVVDESKEEVPNGKVVQQLLEIIKELLGK